MKGTISTAYTQMNILGTKTGEERIHSATDRKFKVCLHYCVLCAHLIVTANAVRPV